TPQPALYASVLSFASVIANFSHTLTPVTDLPTEGPHTASKRLMSRALARASLILLHRNFRGREQRSREACLGAADEALRVLGELEVGRIYCVDALFAYLLGMVAQVYIDEIADAKALTAAVDQPLYASYSALQVDTLATSVRRIIALLTVLGIKCKVMARKAPEVQQAFTAVL
ncbi:hypothetical protein EIP91_007452, partial [Steccherinum ochraceum]